MKWADTPKIRADATVVLMTKKISKPLRRLRSEIHLSHKTLFYTLGISSLRRTDCPITGFGFVNGCLCTHSQRLLCYGAVDKRGIVNREKFIYTNV